MANGLAPYLLNDLKSLVGTSYPAQKVDLKGMLGMLTSGPGANPIQTNTLAGHKREVRFWYRQRNTRPQTDTAASCDQVLTPARKEYTVSVANTRQIAWHLPDELVAQYMEEASQRVNIPGGPINGASAEMFDIIMSGANGILAGVNQDLLGLITWGKNKVSGSNAAVTLNISADTNVQKLTTGMPKLMGDYKKNNLSGTPNIVGAGLFYSWMLAQGYKGIDQSGVNSAAAAGMVNFFADQDFADTVGADHIGVFEPGSIQLVEYLEYTGFKAGQKPGASEFGVIALPAMASDGTLLPVKFDWQLKYIDCPTTLTDAYSGSSSTYQKGWSFIMKKDFGLFQIPSDSYRQEDVNYSVNGSLRYNVTNACDTCS
jgi:hypothetical protein